jgi:putative spermidine/putrescine transport system ATP-binding protein
MNDPPQPAPRAGTVQVESLSKSYGPVHALRSVDLAIEAGEFVALLGPSGSGKTTLLSIIAGFVEPDAGRLRLGGRSMRGVLPHERGLGVVFQHYALFPHLSVYENIAFPLKMRRIPSREIREMVARALALVRLDDLGERRPDQLSGGQQQRVALARALVYQPPVLLLDEPLGALDRRLREEMQTELKEIHERVQATFIYVTHDQEEALSMSDRIVVMRDGAIEQHGRPAEVYDQPANRFVANFVGDCNLWRGTASRLSGGAVQIIEPATGTVLCTSENALVADGDSVAVAVRPEWLRIRVEPGDTCEPDELLAKVIQTRFLGREIQLRCDSPIGEVLVRVDRSERSDVASFGHGRSVALNWDRRLAVLLDQP